MLESIQYFVSCLEKVTRVKSTTLQLSPDLLELERSKINAVFHIGRVSTMDDILHSLQANTGQDAKTQKKVLLTVRKKVIVYLDVHVLQTSCIVRRGRTVEFHLSARRTRGRVQNKVS